MAYQNRNETRLEQAAAILLFPSLSWPLHSTGILAKRTASGTWHWLLQPEEDTELEKRRDAARGDSRSHWLCTINGGQAANRMGGRAVLGRIPRPLLPSGQRVSRNYCAIVWEPLPSVCVTAKFNIILERRRRRQRRQWRRRRHSFNAPISAADAAPAMTAFGSASASCLWEPLNVFVLR